MGVHFKEIGEDKDGENAIFTCRGREIRVSLARKYYPKENEVNLMESVWEYVHRRFNDIFNGELM